MKKVTKDLAITNNRCIYVGGILKMTRNDQSNHRQELPQQL